jgi:hypothetical protein
MSTVSERRGYSSVRAALQVEAVDDDLRVALWNVITVAIIPAIDEFNGSRVTPRSTA